ncbi:MAG: hypothetical protein FWG66_03985 [Spirochaetes bacterium]|nr:hypothetical protein [Spirochaetota bacterium]
MKRILLALTMSAFVAGGAFAQIPLSVGVGGMFTSDFGGGIEISAWGGGSVGITETSPYFGGGGFVFLDMFFAQLSLGFFGAGGTDVWSSGDLSLDLWDQSLVGMDIGLMGKFPIAVSPQMTVFPLLGIVYRLVLSGSRSGSFDDLSWSVDFGDEGMPDASDFNALWFRLGGGLDFSFNQNMFLRTTLTYGIRLANNFENDRVSETERDFSGTDVSVSTRLGHGLDFTVGIGFRLN